MYPFDTMYYCLFNAITNALELLPENHAASVLLRKAQQRAEEMYMGAEEA